MSILNYKGILKGHGDVVTSICTAATTDSNVIVSGSRDKKLIVWQMNQDGYGTEVGTAKKSLSGHGQAIQDCALSAAVGGDKFAISASWDSTLRLWDLQKGVMARKFIGHTSDVNSVAFSMDSRQVVSGSRDKTIKVWNTRSECKFTSPAAESHSDWVSSVRFSPDKSPTIVSASWDKTIKVWSLNDWKVKNTFAGHEAPVHTVTVSPDGSLCASGGKDSVCILWDLGSDKKVYTLETKGKDSGAVNSLCFSPRYYWLCAAMDKAIRIWELEEKKMLCDIVLKFQPSARDMNNGGGAVDGENMQQAVQMVDKKVTPATNFCDLEGQSPSKTLPWATCLQWDYAGTNLFVGTSSGDILVFEQVPENV